MNALDECGRSPLQLAFARLRLIEEDEVAHSTAKKFKAVVMEVVRMLQVCLSKVGHHVNEQENLDSLCNQLEQTTSIEQVCLSTSLFIRVGFTTDTVMIRFSALLPTGASSDRCPL